MFSCAPLARYLRNKLRARRFFSLSSAKLSDFLSYGGERMFFLRQNWQNVRLFDKFYLFLQRF